MKKFLFFPLMAILFVGTIDFLSSCSNASASKVDVVNGTTPMDVHDIQWRTEFINSLKEMTPEQRKAEVDRVLPRLNSQLVASLQQRGKYCEIKSIEYAFGSGKAKEVESGDGNSYDGYYADQLYAIVKGGSCFKDSTIVFIQCLNGTFVIDGESIFSLGFSQPVFVIQKPNGINTYTDYRTSIWLAEVFGLKVHKGQGWSGPIISYKEAYDLYDRLGETAVTVEVYDGDQFDLGNMTYTHNGKVTYAKRE